MRWTCAGCCWRIAIPLALFPCCDGGGGNVPQDDDDSHGAETPYITVTVRSTGEELSSLAVDFQAVEEALLIRSNVDWTAMPSEDWISLEKGDGILSVLKLSINLTGEDRAGTLRFASADGDVLAEISVKQGFTNIISASDFMDMMLVMDSLTEDEFKGCLRHEKDGVSCWLFDAFCFSRTRWNGSGIESIDMTEEVEEAMIDDYFTEGGWLDALDDAVEDLKSEIPGEYVPRKVIIAVPDVYGGSWGEIDGNEVRPTADNRADRVKIAGWFVDKVIAKFAAWGRGNLRLAGFYWQQENGDILPEYGKMVAGHVHSYGLKFYWIPYFGAYNWAEWVSYGFDAAWLQPNYLFRDNLTKDRLYEACSLASGKNMYVEMELDNTCSLQKQIEYWDVFGELGLLDTMPVAYYESGSGFPNRQNHTIAAWKAFYDRMADDIAARQKKFYSN